MIYGRLGNQLFQYAFARALQQRNGGQLVFDFSLMNYKDENLDERIMQGFDNHLQYYNVASYEYVDVSHPKLHSTLSFQKKVFVIWRKIKAHLSDKQVQIFERVDFFLLWLLGIYYVESPCANKFILPPLRRSYLCRGYFESENYFSKIKDILKEELTPKFPLSGYLSELKDELKKRNAIFVHIRRGDFVNASNNLVVCTPEYYKKAIAYVLDRYPESMIFVCSNDIEYCKNNIDFGTNNVKYEPTGIKEWQLFELMRSCFHFVLSNSTLSWWAQYLSDNKDKVVIAPRRWRNQPPYPDDIYQSHWIKM